MPGRRNRQATLEQMELIYQYVTSLSEAQLDQAFEGLPFDTIDDLSPAQASVLIKRLKPVYQSVKLDKDSQNIREMRQILFRLQAKVRR